MTETQFNILLLRLDKIIRLTRGEAKAVEGDGAVDEEEKLLVEIVQIRAAQHERSVRLSLSGTNNPEEVENYRLVMIEAQLELIRYRRSKP